ncbi:MAG TPA: tetratricopeptide repeat protein [Candidatus Binatia bacterium]|nr:tetratricopeptide repeat protein [Candidatus Binatia bacterium]
MLFALIYVIWLPLQGPFVRLLAAAAGRALRLVEHPPILTALTSRGNSITIHSHLTGESQPLTTMDCESLHLSVVASLALALSVSAKRWSTRAGVCGLALSAVFSVMLVVCVVQLQWLAESYATAHLGITLYTAREKALLDWAIRKSSFAAVYLVPALLFLASYLSFRQDAGPAASMKPDKTVRPAPAPSPASRWRWRSASLAVGGCAAAGLLVLSAQADPDGPTLVEGLRKIVALNPSSPRAHYSLALKLEKEGMLDEALDSYRTSLRLRPDLVEAHLGEGNVFFRKGDYAQATRCYGEVLERQPGNTDARFNLATAFLNRGDFDLAAQSFEEVLRAAPGLASAHKGLGEALLRLNRRCDALPHLERSAEMDPRLSADAPLRANISILRSTCGRD